MEECTWTGDLDEVDASCEALQVDGDVGSAFCPEGADGLTEGIAEGEVGRKAG